jgi:hypothetical protein
LALGRWFVAKQDITVAEGTALGESKGQLGTDLFEKSPTAADGDGIQLL